MFVPQKPWPFGNEYHDAGCADSDIIWALELCEEKIVQHNSTTKNLMSWAKQLELYYI